ncbi:hypothetical protein M3Y98_00151900 [Aphelenchoides besseyi]|nr:hypothetical protein M3Y98_00151900 [Aphelenchoides besseyi]KAI6199807.1 hypothetical protein M3Y96_00666200 [Aphelenchoides besseyi]
MVVDISKLSAYESPIPVSLYPQVTFVLFALGLLFSSWFFISEVTATAKTRNLLKELLTGALAALFLGFATVFLFLWVGIYI